MDAAIEFLSWGAILSGGIFCIIGSIGLIRLPDVYCRMHAAGIIDTIGIGLIFLGLAFQAGWSLALAKLIMIMIFVLYTSPTSCHALCRAAAYGGVHPVHGKDMTDEDISLREGKEAP